jgi:integration host factor subunit beta
MTDSTVTKADLVEEVANVTKLPRKESEAVVEIMFESIIGALQGGDRI